jgi:threonine-phosphate decarboxylase
VLYLHYYEHGGYPDALDFSVNINPLGCPVDITDFDTKAIIENYPDPHCSQLREKLSEKWAVPKEYIVCGNGASDIIMRICSVLRPRRVFTLTHTFSEYERCVKLFGGSIETDNFDTAFICRPNNPDGKLVSEEIIIKMLEKGVTVVIDECFVEFTEFKSLIYLTEKYRNLIILNAFTKIYAMAGLRLGYAVCSDTELIKNINSHGSAWSVSGIAQRIGIEVLKNQNFITETRLYVAEEREFMLRKLSNFGLECYDSKANFIMIKSQKPLFKGLYKKGIAVRDCSNFAGLDEHYIRIGLKKHDDNIKLIEEIANELK